MKHDRGLGSTKPASPEMPAQRNNPKLGGIHRGIGICPMGKSSPLPAICPNRQNIFRRVSKLRFPNPLPLKDYKRVPKGCSLEERRVLLYSSLITNPISMNPGSSGQGRCQRGWAIP